MTTKSKVSTKRLTDGPPGNSVEVYAVMLEVSVEGTPPITRRIATFDDGYQGIAESFCKWMNKELGATQ